MVSNRQREADAAWFEDWSEWANLGPAPKSPYYCLPCPSLTAFDICVPSHVDIIGMVERIPGAARDRRMIRTGSYRVPVAAWRALRASLPAIKTAVISDCERYAAEARKHHAVAAATVAKRIAEAASGERDLAGKIDACANAALLRSGKYRTPLNDWERKFALDLADRWQRYGERTKISDKQLAALDAIHDKIAHYVVI